MGVYIKNSNNKNSFIYQYFFQEILSQSSDTSLLSEASLDKLDLLSPSLKQYLLAGSQIMSYQDGAVYHNALEKRNQVRDSIDNLFDNLHARIGINSVILTGGASKILGIENFSENIFNRKSRVGKVENKVVCSAEFAVVLPHIINYYKVKG